MLRLAQWDWLRMKVGNTPDLLTILNIALVSVHHSPVHHHPGCVLRLSQGDY